MNLDAVHCKDLSLGEFSFESNMAFGRDDDVVGEFLSHECFGDYPALCKTIFPLDGIDHAVDRTEWAHLIFKLLSHVVVLLIAPTPLEAKKLFGGKFVFDRHAHDEVLSSMGNKKRSGLS